MAQSTSPAIQVPAIMPAQSIGVPLVDWQDVSTSALAPYAPDPSLPMARYAVMTVMSWAQAQGYAGAIPTWEVGDGTWGVILIHPHPALSQVAIPLSSMEPFDTSDPDGWGQAVMRWATAQDPAYPMAIPTFQTDGTSVTALAFGAAYPGLSFYDAPNTQLFQSLAQARKLVNLQDPAVWANAVMRVGMANGYAAAWPTWECTTNRGMMGMSAMDWGPLPEPTDENVDRVKAILTRTAGVIDSATTRSLADFSGIYLAFNEQPIASPAVTALVDTLLGLVQIGLNLIPGVGGALGSLVGSGQQVVQDATSGQGSSGPTSLATYQDVLSTASDAIASYVAGLQSALNAAQGAALRQLWGQTYQSPLGGPPVPLGMLANTPEDTVTDDSTWEAARQQLTRQFNMSLKQSITTQLYTVVRRTYYNSSRRQQKWSGTIAEITAPGGSLGKYIADSEENLSMWFTDLAQDGGSVTTTDFWLQATGSDSEYPPADLVYALFSDDGFGTTTGYIGEFSKETVYSQWPAPTLEIGDGGDYGQQWAYNTSAGNIVEVWVTADPDTLVGWTDGHGNVGSDTSHQSVESTIAICEFQQGVIVNYLAPLN